MTTQDENAGVSTKEKNADIEAARRAFRRSSILLFLGVVYAIVPTDLIPDVPFVGWIDDIVVLSATFVNSAYQYRKLKKQTRQTDS